MSSRKRIRGVCDQRGAVAVEFAFVFPILFMLMYGTVVYAYVFVIQQSLTFAAQEAAEAVVQLDPSADPDYQQVAKDMVDKTLTWLPRKEHLAKDVTVVNEGVQPCPSTSDCISVVVTYNLEASALFPEIRVGGLALPPIPDTLRATAVARI